MSLTLVLPGPLRDLNGGRASLEIPGAPATVGDALGVLRERNRSVYDRLVTERGEIRPHVNVFVGVDDIRWSGGLATPLVEGKELVVLPSVSGG